VLPSLLSEYHLKDIFNADKNGLFSNHPWTKPDKITVLVCSDMDGSEKMSLLVIGKSEKPR
jgi:hypothetical protein